MKLDAISASIYSIVCISVSTSDRNGIVNLNSLFLYIFQVMLYKSYTWNFKRSLGLNLKI